MKLFLKRFAEPLRSIEKRPYHFTFWWLVTNVLGLTGFWLPLILTLAGGESAKDSLKFLFKAGILASFGIVILAEGVAAALVEVKTGSNIIAAGIRGIAGLLAILFAVIQVGVLIKLTGGDFISIYFQIIVTFLSILLASYLYCFRFSDWEKSVADFKQRDDEEVNELRRQATSKDIDDGVKL